MDLCELPDGVNNYIADYLRHRMSGKPTVGHE